MTVQSIYKLKPIPCVIIAPNKIKGEGKNFDTAFLSLLNEYCKTLEK